MVDPTTLHPAHRCHRRLRDNRFVADTLHVYTKNARINTEQRVVALLSELSSISWHSICFSETRCLTQDVVLQGGHRLIAHLESKQASGVAILIHREFVDKFLRKHSISNRVLAVDVRVGHKVCRIISCYLPHAGYHQDVFMETLDQITALTMEAQNQNKAVVIGGDFNLTLGRGERGQALQDLCSQCSLTVANGHGAGDATDVWTFCSSLGALRRIDFIIHSTALSARYVSASREIDLGSDHRCVRASFQAASNPDTCSQAANERLEAEY